MRSVFPVPTEYPASKSHAGSAMASKLRDVEAISVCQCDPLMKQSRDSRSTQHPQRSQRPEILGRRLTTKQDACPSHDLLSAKPIPVGLMTLAGERTDPT
jgi:hypothetical protein